MILFTLVSAIKSKVTVLKGMSFGELGQSAVQAAQRHIKQETWCCLPVEIQLAKSVGIYKLT
jgi:hypothetical protein